MALEIKFRLDAWKVSNKVTWKVPVKLLQILVLEHFFVVVQHKTLKDRAGFERPQALQQYNSTTKEQALTNSAVPGQRLPPRRCPFCAFSVLACHDWLTQSRENPHHSSFSLQTQKSRYCIQRFSFSSQLFSRYRCSNWGFARPSVSTFPSLQV